MHTNLKLVLGPPGTGKTFYLLSVMERLLADGLNPKRLAVLSFTRKAAQEFKDRAMKKFKYQDEDLPWIRTVHSLVFKQLGYKKNQTVQDSDYRKLGEMIGVSFQGSAFSEDGVVDAMGEGYKLVFLENLARATGVSLHDVWRKSDHGTEWGELEKFQRAYNTFKRNKMLVDFSDMLEAFIAQRLAPDVDVLLVDEAQDLSKLQWDVVKIIAARCSLVYVCGDDHQAIFGWAGADVNYFIGLQGETTILNQSYRITKAMHPLATSISKRISNSREKPFLPRDEVGSLETWSTFEDVDMGEGEWLLLARNGYMLRAMENYCQQNGYSYATKSWSPLTGPSMRAVKSWSGLIKNGSILVSEFEELGKFLGSNISTSGMREISTLDGGVICTLERLKDYGLKTAAPWFEALKNLNPRDRDYFLAARRRGESLVKEPRIKISTIHGVKGGEADNVLLLTDVSKTTYDSMVDNYDDEARVFYVGCTRAKKRMNVVAPKTNLYFDL